MQNINLVMPQSLEAEEAVLGAILLDGKSFVAANKILTAEDFYRNKHGIIYQAMCALHAENQPIDIITVFDYLNKTNQAEAVGGLAALSQMANSVLTSTHIKYHAGIVKEKSKKRSVIVSCRKTMQAMYDDEDFAIHFNAHRLRLNSLTLDTSDAIASMKDVAKEIIAFVERRHSSKHDLSGIKSGLMELDDLTDGFQSGDLIVIGARPGMGKSLFAMTILKNSGIPAGFVSLEMSSHQIGIRLLSSTSNVPMWNLRKGIIQKGQWVDVMRGGSDMATLPIYFSFTARKARDIEKVIVEMIEKYGIKIVCVDYLQLIRSDGSKQNREREIAEISCMLKSIAVDYQIPVIAVAQLNRELEKRENKRPILADLRESGAIEQDADVVIFLYRDEYYSPNSKYKGIMEVIIAKGRNTARGMVKVAFNTDTMKISNLLEEE